jgi:YHS domain-containing protein
MYIDPKSADSFSEIDGVNYYFCCSGCKEKFEAEPAAYV